MLKCVWKLSLCYNDQCTYKASSIFSYTSPKSWCHYREQVALTDYCTSAGCLMRRSHKVQPFFPPLCSCLLKLKGDAAEFKPCYSWTKRHVRPNLVRNCISAQRGSCGSKSINFLSSGTDDLFYCSSMTVWNEIGFHIWTGVKNSLAL